MSEANPPCPACESEYTYEQGDKHVCSMCQFEFVPGEAAESAEAAPVIRDSAGNVLADGDDVTVITDLKVKGAGGPIKRGTKVRGIRLIDGVGDHDIDCKIDGFGPMQLKSSVVKKA